MGCGSSSTSDADGKKSPDQKKEEQTPTEQKEESPRQAVKPSSPRKAAGHSNKTKEKYVEEEEMGDTESNDKGFKKRVRQRLIDATKDGDMELLTKTVDLFERQKLEDCGDLKRAKDKLYFLKLKRDLRDCVRRRHAGVLDKTIEEAKSSKYADKLNANIEAAERLRTHLQELNHCSHDVSKMEQSTISELRSYQRPPACVHDVMAATYMLMGYPENKLGEWTDIQAHLGQLTRDKLIRQVSEFDSKNVDEETTSRVKDILKCYSLDEVQDASNGAATFYVWSNSIVDKIDKDNEEEEQRVQQTEEQPQQPQQQNKGGGSGKRKG